MSAESTAESAVSAETGGTELTAETGGAKSTAETGGAELTAETAEIGVDMFFQDSLFRQNNISTFFILKKCRPCA